jgi:hypothetical protein
MSTKIYNAYKILHKINEFEYADGLRRALQECYETEIIKSLVRYQESTIEQVLCHDHFIERYIDQAFQPDIDRKIGKCETSDLIDLIDMSIGCGMRLPMNFLLQMVIYYHSHSFYVQFFGIEDFQLCRNYIRGQIDAGELTDYHYQNSTDKPDSITDFDWNQREEVWDAILGDSGTPSVAGWSFDFWNAKWEIMHSYEKRRTSNNNSI